MKLRSLFRPLAALSLFAALAALPLASCGGGGGGGADAAASLSFKGLMPEGCTQATMTLAADGVDLTITFTNLQDTDGYEGTSGRAEGDIFYDNTPLDYDSAVSSWEHGTDNEDKLFRLSLVRCGEPGYYVLLMEDLLVDVTSWDAARGVMEGTIDSGWLTLKDEKATTLATFDLTDANVTMTYTGTAP